MKYCKPFYPLVYEVVSRRKEEKFKDVLEILENTAGFVKVHNGFGKPTDFLRSITCAWKYKVIYARK